MNSITSVKMLNDKQILNAFLNKCASNKIISEKQKKYFWYMFYNDKANLHIEIEKIRNKNDL